MVPPAQSAQAFHELAINYEVTVDQELRSSWGMSYSGFVEQLIDYAELQGSERILDIATGTGLIPRTLTARPTFTGTVAGLDITYPALEIGKEKLSASRSAEKRVSFICASALALPFSPASFDCVICALATHHIDQDCLIAQARHALKPGGKFILADVEASPSWRFPGVKTLLRLAAFAYFFFSVSPARAWVESDAVSYVHTKEEWQSALREHGFTTIRACCPAVRQTWAPSAMMLVAS